MEMKPMSIAGQQEIITKLQQWAGVQEIYTPLLMNEAHIMQMATNPLFEIGAHTVNHPALGVLSAEEQKNEIQKGRYILEKLTGRSITGLAYPYGSLNQDTPLLTQTLGFDYAVSTSALHATHRSAIYDLPRFQVKNMNSKDFAGMLTGLHQSKV
jgi:peptidoglycan/xylan/chitin deacetylase (PgdA/CDA1 family)